METLISEDLKSYSLFAHCTIINNTSLEFSNPIIFHDQGQIHFERGKHHAPQYRILPEQTIKFASRKKKSCNKGSAGVITYESPDDRKIYIMWQIGHSQNNYIGIGTGLEEASKELYSKFYNPQEGEKEYYKVPAISNEKLDGKVVYSCYDSMIKISAEISYKSHCFINIKLERIAESEFLSRFFKCAAKLLAIRKELAQWLTDYIKDMKTQEIAVASAKTVNAAAASTAAILICIPFTAPIGLIMGACVGGSSLLTFAGDTIARKIKLGFLRDKVQLENSLYQELKKLTQAVKLQAIREAERTYEDADTVFQRYLREISHSNISASLRIGQNIGSTIFSATGASRAAGLAEGIKGIKGGAAAAGGARVALAGLSEFLGAIGAVVSIADATISWATKSPNRIEAEQRHSDIQESIAKLEDLILIENEQEESRQIDS
ncbi:hypothetical protein FGO68_gene12222 [Halteria grandinella]|uniref:Uncharacterized protein n=1 Tax=Halteria grandinella TaxID=5974 RepID=A0A8J8NRG6_HALGN|nr:hypothetical protein FGO68_gene12222 [Halteria grandinella]